MMPYPAQQPYPYAPVPPLAPQVAPPYAMPQPGYGMPYPQYPAPMVDPIEARLRHYAQMGADTALGTVQGNDPRLLNVIDAAVGAMQNSVRSSEKKTAAALDALTSLIEKHRTADLNQHIQRSGGQTHAAGLDLESSPVAQVNQVLATLVERLNSLEKSLSGSHRAPAGSADARQIEDRVGEALEALSREIARPAGLMDQQPGAQPRAPRPGLRPRITVPRGGSNAAVAEIEARQRWLDATPRPANGPETAALEAIRKSIAALADQVRETRRIQENPPESGLQTEVQELQRLVGELAPRQSVTSLGDAIRGLAAKVEQSRQDGVRESSLAPIERLLGDMRITLEDLRNPRGFEAINATIGQLAHRVEALGERSMDSGLLTDIQRQIVGIRSAIAEAGPAASMDGLNQQIRALGAKLDDLAERPRDTRVMSLLTHAVEDVRDNLKRLDPEVLAERIERRLSGIESLEVRIGQLADRLATQGLGGTPAGLESLEARIDKLTDRLAANAASGKRPATGGMTGLEGIEARLDKLSERLSGEPAGALDGLTQRIEAMTRTLSQRKAEPDLSPIVARIDEVREALARQSGGDLTAIEQRIAQMQQALERRTGEPDMRSLEQILRKLAEKIESARAPDASATSLDDLQTQMAQLAERLDRATPGHPALGGLERTLSDLCQKVAGLQDAAGGGMGSLGAGSMDTLAAEGMVLIKRDLTEMKSAQAEAEVRSREVLQHVNATLEKIVGRLASLEGDISSGRVAAPKASLSAPPPSVPAPPTTAPNAAIANVGRSAPVLAKTIEAPVQVERVARPEPALAPAPVTTPVRTPLAAAASAGPMDFDADLPLEPGAGRGGRPEAPAASAAPAGDDPRSNFIAAARRAAQAAAAQTSAAISEAEAKSGRLGKLAGVAGAGGGLDGIKAVLVARRKPILLGVAALLVLISGLKVMTTFMKDDRQQMPKISEVTPSADQPAAEAPAARQSSAPAPEKKQGDPQTVGSIGLPPITAAPTAEMAAQQPLPQLAPQQEAMLPAAEQVTDVAALMKSTNVTAPERLKQLAVNGNLSAVYEIGARLAEGRGTLRDQKAAAQWIEYAANQGFAPAQYRFGSFNREGIGLAKDSKKAFAWFQKAAQQGNILAMHNLGVLYAEGVNGAPDYAAAAQWFKNAAEHGVKDSQFNIAILNVRGLGVATDLTEAYKWFAAAARQGDADAGKKRDEIAARLSPDKQAEVKAAADAFQAKRPDPRANELSVPEGGWEGAARFPTAAMNKKGKV